MGADVQRHAPAALPAGRTRYPLYERLGRPPGQFGRVREILLPTGIRSPDGSVRSNSLYRLSYPGLHTHPKSRVGVLSVRKVSSSWFNMWGISLVWLTNTNNLWKVIVQPVRSVLFNQKQPHEPDGRQHSCRRSFILPWVDVHVFLFHVWQLALCFFPTVLEDHFRIIYSASIYALLPTNTLFFARLLLVRRGKCLATVVR